MLEWQPTRRSPECARLDVLCEPSGRIGPTGILSWYELLTPRGAHLAETAAVSHLDSSSPTKPSDLLAVKSHNNNVFMFSLTNIAVCCSAETVTTAARLHC